MSKATPNTFKFSKASWKKGVFGLSFEEHLLRHGLRIEPEEPSVPLPFLHWFPPLSLSLPHSLLPAFETGGR